MNNSITVSISFHIATITFNRPKSLNALTLEDIGSLAKELRKCEDSNDVAVVVMRGAGERSFSAGADIGIFENFKSKEDASNFWKNTAPAVHIFIEKMSKPVICIVSGYCLGGGLELALACDLVIATEDSKFGFPEVNLGLVPGWGGTQRISRFISRHKAKQLILLGEMIDADEALRLGLVNWVVKRDEIEKFASGLLEKLCKKSAYALKAAKQAVNRAYELPLDKGLELETELDTWLIGTSDAEEGIRAFLEKRKPVFKKNTS